MKYILGTIDPLSLPKVNIEFEQETITQAQDILNKAETKLENIENYDGGIEVGTILTQMSGPIPINYLECDGSYIYNNEYMTLYNKLLKNDINEDLNPITAEVNNCYPWLNQNWLKTNRESIIDKKWVTVGNLPAQLNNNKIIITNKKMYMFSSGTATGTESKIYSFNILENGDIIFDQYLNLSLDTIIVKYGAFTINHNMFLLGNTIYIIFAADQTTRSYVCAIHIDENGVLEEKINILPVTTTGANYYRLGDYLYTGGIYSRYPIFTRENSDIYNAIANPNTFIGFNQIETLNDPNLNAKAFYGVATLNKTIYYIGGGTGTNYTTGQTTIYKADIIDGVIMPSSLYKYTLPAAMLTRNNSCFVTNNKIYIINALDNKMYTANILEDDIITKFELAMVLPFTGVNRSYAIIDSYIYSFGEGSIERLYIGGKGLINYYDFQSNTGYKIFEKTTTGIPPESINPLVGNYSFTEKEVTQERSTLETLDIFNDNNCLAYYPLNGNSFDFGGVYNGLDVGVDYNFPGKFENCVKIGPNTGNGIKSDIIYPNIPSNADLTISTWIKTDETTVPALDTVLIVGVDSNTASVAGNRFMLGFHQGNICIDRYGQVKFLAKSGILYDNNWHHVAVTVERIAGFLYYSLYIDGIFVEKIKDTLTTLVLKNDTFINIGAGLVSSGNFKNGFLDNVRIYTKSLNFTEVKILTKELTNAVTATTLDDVKLLIKGEYVKEENGETSTLDIIDPFVDSSCLAYYRLNETGLDETENYDGELINCSFEYNGKFGSCLKFDGSNNSRFKPAINDGSCLSFWFFVADEVTSVTSASTIGTWNQIGSYNSIGLGSYTAGITGETLNVNWWSTSNTDGRYIGIQDNIPAGWNHVVIQWTGSNWEIYLNNTKRTLITAGTLRVEPLDPIFGGRAYQSTIGDNFIGLLDQIRVFSRALDASEVNTLYFENYAGIPVNNNNFISTKNYQTEFENHDASTQQFYIKENRDTVIEGVVCENGEPWLHQHGIERSFPTYFKAWDLDNRYDDTPYTASKPYWVNDPLKGKALVFDNTNRNLKFDKTNNAKSLSFWINPLKAVTPIQFGTTKKTTTGSYIPVKDRNRYFQGTTYTINNYWNLPKKGFCYKIEFEIGYRRPASNTKSSITSRVIIYNNRTGLVLLDTGSIKSDQTNNWYWKTFTLNCEIWDTDNIKIYYYRAMTYDGGDMTACMSYIKFFTYETSTTSNSNNIIGSLGKFDCLTVGENTQFETVVGETLALNTFEGTGNAILRKAYTTAPLLQDWNHIVVQYEPDSPYGYQFYINNVKVPMQLYSSNNDSSKLPYKPWNLMFGNNYIKGTNYLSALLTNIHISNNILSENDIMQLNKEYGDLNFTMVGTLPQRSGWNTTFVTKNRVYMCGGSTSTTSTNTPSDKTWTAVLLEDGSLGEWEAGPQLPEACIEAKPVIIKNKIYLFNYYNTVYSTNQFVADILEDGTISEWTISNSPLPYTCGSAEVIVIKNKVYIFGGIISGTTYRNTSLVSFINEDGTLGKWLPGPNIPQTLIHHTATIIKDRLYLFGGHNGTVSIANAYYSVIDEHGSLGSWISAPSLAYAIHYPNMIVTKNKIFLIGGNTSGVFTNNIMSAPIDSNGVVGIWNISATKFPEIIHGSKNLFFNTEYCYILGGRTGATWVDSDKIYRISLPGGKNDYLSDTYTTKPVTDRLDWELLPNELPSPHSWGATFMTKNRVYVCGGSSSGATNTTIGSTTVHTTEIDSNGELGTNWTTGPNLPSNVYTGKFFITKNRVFLYVSHNGSAYTNIMYSATINSDGTINNWVTETALPGILFQPMIVTTRHRVYMYSGLNGTTTYGHYGYTATINEDGSLGAWATAPNLPVITYIGEMFVTNRRVYLLGGRSAATTYNTNIYVASIKDDGTLGYWSKVGYSPTQTGNSKTIVLNNKVYFFPSYNGIFSLYVPACYVADIDEKGVLGKFRLTRDPQFPMHGTGLFVTSNYIYALSPRLNASYSANWNDSKAIYRAPLVGGKNDYLEDHYSIGNYLDVNRLTTVEGPACGCDGPNDNFNSAYFNGQSYINVPYLNDYNLGTSDFTIELYTKIDSYQNPGRIFNTWNTATASVPQFDILCANGNLLMFAVSTDGVNIGAILTATGYTIQTWYHIAVTRSGNTYRMFIDGNLVDEVTTATTLNLQVANTCTLGARRSGATYIEHFKGFISNVRLSKGIARYTETFTPPMEPKQGEEKVILLINFDTGGITDSTQKQNIGTNGQIQINEYNSKYDKGSLTFDGQADFITTSLFLEDNFTISFWVNINNINTTLGYLGTYLDASNGWYLTHTNGIPQVTNGSLLFGCGSTTTGTYVTTKYPLIIKQWTHIAITKKGYNATDLDIYIDGINATFKRSQGSNLFSSPLPLKIGVGVNTYFSGSMDQIRVYDRVLDAEEIMYLAHESEPIINGQYKTGLILPNVKYGIIKAEEG